MPDAVMEGLRSEKLDWLTDWPGRPRLMFTAWTYWGKLESCYCGCIDESCAFETLSMRMMLLPNSWFLIGPIYGLAYIWPAVCGLT
jgi:hypothetical protein